MWKNWQFLKIPQKWEFWTLSPNKYQKSVKNSQKGGENALNQLPTYLNFRLVSKKIDSKAKKKLRNCLSSNARCPPSTQLPFLNPSKWNQWKVSMSPPTLTSFLRPFETFRHWHHFYDGTGGRTMDLVRSSPSSISSRTVRDQKVKCPPIKISL